jgi:hypothetical protein
MVMSEEGKEKVRELKSYYIGDIPQRILTTITYTPLPA